jgi:hypothetical protein
MPLGKTKGSYKGELEVVELFGVDASWAKIKRGTSFSPTDLVYLKPQETTASPKTPTITKPEEPKKK